MNKFINILHIYLNYLLTWVSGGRYSVGEIISSIGIRPLVDRLLTRNMVTRVIHIHTMPFEYEPHLTEQISADMKVLFPKANVVFGFSSVPVFINPDNAVFISQRNRASDMYEAIKKALGLMTETELDVGVSVRTGLNRTTSLSKRDLVIAKQNWDSFSLATRHSRSGKAISYTHMFVHVQAPDNKVLNKVIAALKSNLQGQGIGFTILKSSMNVYLTQFGPASSIPSTMSMKQTFLPRESLIHLLPLTGEGLINTTGLALGVNVNNGLPFLLNFFGSGQGQNIMMCAKTGWGKTHLAFALTLGLLGEGVHVSVTDLKGDEWRKIGVYTPYKEVSFSGAKARSVNSLRLDDLEATRDDCEVLYSSAVTATTRILSMMAEITDPSQRVDVERSIEQAILALYQDRGVLSTNPDTFIKTRGLRYESVIPFLSEAASNHSLPEEVRDSVRLAEFRISGLLNGSSALAMSLRNEMSVKEIIDSPMVIYSFNKNTDTNLTISETISVFMAEYLSTKKHQYRKRQGKQSAIFAEEVQRYEDDGEIVNFLVSQTTGARSQNVMVVFLLNSLAKLESPAFAPIRSNVFTSFLGLLSAEDIQLASKFFGLTDIEENLREISKEPAVYKNVFAVSYNTGSQHGRAMIKAMLPAEMNKTLATREVISP